MTKEDVIKAVEEFISDASGPVEETIDDLDFIIEDIEAIKDSLRGN